MREKHIFQFIQEPIKFPGYSENGWFTYERKLAIYVRKGPVYINGIHFNLVFQIANVSVKNEKDKDQGLFTEFLKRAEIRVLNFNYDAIYIENIQQKRFWEFFINRGYETIFGYSSSLPHCCFKIYNEEYVKDKIAREYSD